MTSIVTPNPGALANTWTHRAINEDVNRRLRFMPTDFGVLASVPNFSALIEGIGPPSIPLGSRGSAQWPFALQAVVARDIVAGKTPSEVALRLAVQEQQMRTVMPSLRPAGPGLAADIAAAVAQRRAEVAARYPAGTEARAMFDFRRGELEAKAAAEFGGAPFDAESIERLLYDCGVGVLESIGEVQRLQMFVQAVAGDDRLDAFKTGVAVESDDGRKAGPRPAHRGPTTYFSYLIFKYGRVPLIFADFERLSEAEQERVRRDPTFDFVALTETQGQDHDLGYFESDAMLARERQWMGGGNG
jgi:hypothetical protein